MEQQPSEVTFRRQFARDRGENFSLPYGVADCAAPPVSKRRLRSGPNLHPGDTHHCADGLFARDKQLVHDSANACSLVLFLARPRAGAAGVETCMELNFPGRQRSKPAARTPGGSGGGSAAAVAVRMCPAATGSQTEGSILRPAAYARIVGLKPTVGRISMHGVVSLSWSMDTIDPMVNCVYDAALVLKAIAGHDPSHSRSSTEPVPDYRLACDQMDRPLRIGLLREFFLTNAVPKVRKHTEDTAERLAAAGADVDEVSLPASFASALDAHATVVNVETVAFHEELFRTRTPTISVRKLRETIQTGCIIPAIYYARRSGRIAAIGGRRMRSPSSGTYCSPPPSMPWRQTTWAPSGIPGSRACGRPRASRRSPFPPGSKRRPACRWGCSSRPRRLPSRASHGTTTLGSYLPQAIRAGPRREFQSPIRGRGLRRATSVQTPIAVRAKLASGRHAPLRRRPLCPRQTACTRFRERMQPRVVPCASARRRRRGGNLHGTKLPWASAQQTRCENSWRLRWWISGGRGRSDVPRRHRLPDRGLHSPARRLRPYRGVEAHRRSDQHARRRELVLVDGHD